MDFVTGLLIVMGIASLAVISPGPDFLIVLRNALCHGRKSGVATALGIGVAIYFHIAYCMVGLAFVISQSIWLFSIIKFAGAAYLIWLGIQALRSKGWEMRARDIDQNEQGGRSVLASFRDGLLTNMLNPKATLFFLAVFTQVIAPDTPLWWQFSYGSAIAGMACVWFITVSFALTQRHVRQALSRVSIWIDRITGVAFIALAAKIISSKTS